MDCMASNAVAKNGVVLSSRPPQAESWNGRSSCDRPNVSLIRRHSLIAKTGSTFDRKKTASGPTAMQNRNRPNHTSLMARADQLKAKPLRGGPAGRP
jgi:hypothetical protein